MAFREGRRLLVVGSPGAQMVTMVGEQLGEVGGVRAIVLVA
jgi:hypothetical protein